MTEVVMYDGRAETATAYEVCYDCYAMPIPEAIRTAVEALPRMEP